MHAHQAGCAIATLKRRVGALPTMVMAMLLAGAGACAAQVVALPGDDYGRVVLPERQSIGSAVGYVQAMGSAFEPISQLRPDDRLTLLSQPVGRLDILVETTVGTTLTVCTGAFVRRDLVMTNHHCVPGRGGRVVRASIVLNYLKSDGHGARRVELETTPVEGDAELDYALVRVKSGEHAGVEPIQFSDRVPRPRDRLRIIHHPAGQPKMMTQFRCSVATSSNVEEPTIRHVCDTMQGSSGAVLFDHDEMKVLGLHHSGGLNQADPESFNRASSVRAILAHSRVMREMAPSPGAQSEQRSTTVAPTEASGSDVSSRINDLLKR